MGSSNFFILNDNNKDNPIATAYIDNNNDLYQINFYKKNSSIYIECHNTSRDTNTIYSYDLTLDEIKQTGVYSNLDQMINFCKELNNSHNCQIEKKNDYIILKIILDQNKKLKLKMVKDINSLKDAINQIKILMKENEYLKNRLDKIEKENEKMKLNFFYNSFDTNAYKIENIYNSLKANNESLIIINKYDLRLINQGVKFLFNKIISNFKIIYRNMDDFDPITYHNFSNQLLFYVIVVLTKDKRRFGALCNKKIQNNIGMNGMQNNNNIIGNMGMNNNLENNINQFNIQMNNQLDINQNNNMNMNNMMGLNNNMNNNGLNQNMMGMGGLNMGLNQNNQIQEINNNEVFSSSSSLNEYFVFSLDNYKLYYCDKITTFNVNVPNFTIFYDTNRQSLYGTEISANNNNLANSQSLMMSQQNINSQPNIAQQMNNSQSDLYKLSGKSQFNIKYFEIFGIELKISS